MIMSTQAIPGGKAFDEFIGFCSERDIIERLLPQTNFVPLKTLLWPPPVRSTIIGGPSQEEIQKWHTKLADPVAERDPEIASVLSERRQLLESNPVYKWLHAQPDFTNAWQTFEGKKKTKGKSRYRHLLADFNFLAISASHAARYFGVGKSRKGSFYPSKSKLMKAKSGLKKLLAAFEGGVRLNCGSDNAMLQRLLISLDKEIAIALVGRKPRDDATTPEREFVRLLALDLMQTFGEASPEIICDLARMVGIDRDKSTIDRQLTKLRTSYRLALAAALRAHPQKSAKTS